MIGQLIFSVIITGLSLGIPIYIAKTVKDSEKTTMP